MPLFAFSPELLLLVASHLHQVHLLNLSLVCKHLHAVIESELYREYNNPLIHGRSLLPFIRKLLERPVLQKHVRRIDLFAWTTSSVFQPYFHGVKDPGKMETLRENTLSEKDYHLCAQAARAAGVICDIDPYETKSRLIDVAEHRSRKFERIPRPWYKHLFDDGVSFWKTPYDRKFCQLLRAGVEDAQVVLLLALLPKLQVIVLRSGPYDSTALEWRAGHQFASLRELTVCAPRRFSRWHLGFFNALFAKASKLDTLQACGGSTRFNDISDPEPLDFNKRELTLQPNSLRQLQTLDLMHCILKHEDLRSLILHCPGLKSFYLHCGGLKQQKTDYPTPVAIIEMLKPLGETLEVLSLNIVVGDDDIWHSDNVDYRLDSLRHMTALRTLDTCAEMWKGVGPDDLDYQGIDSDRGQLPDRLRLCHRLPPSLQTLVFHLSYERIGPALAQVSDLIQVRPDLLPNLQTLSIGAYDDYYIHELNRLVFEKATRIQAGPHPLNIRIGGHPETTTVFDTMVRPPHLPHTKWFGNKYSMRYRKPSEHGMAMN